jgi:putative transposase
MIDRTHALPVSRQARLLGMSRSSAYYLPRAFSDADLALMRRIDLLHLEHPFAGARMLVRMLRRNVAFAPASVPPNLVPTRPGQDLHSCI